MVRRIFVTAWVVLTVAGGAWAQEDDLLEDEFALLEEEEIVYTAAKHKQDIAESPSAISVITREQIESTHCTDVICLLRQLPEVDVRRILPMYSAVGARALSGELGDRALVMVDGMEVNNEVFGMAFWQIFPIHLDDVERIEVIRGPGSALYGANAHSMVVSITTRRIGERAAEVYLGGGEHDRTSLCLKVSYSLDDWSLQLSGSIDTAGNWRIQDKREREIYRARLRLDRETDSSASSFQAMLTIPRGYIYTSLAPGYSSDTTLGDFLFMHQVDAWKFKVSLGLWKVVIDPDMLMYFGEIKMGEFTENMDVFNSTLDGEAQIELEPFPGNLLIMGGNYRWITMISDQLTPETSHQHRVGLFIHDEQRLGKSLTLTGGIRFDLNTITPFTVSPRLAVVWRFSEGQQMRLAGGRAFRKPSFFNSSLHFNNVEGEPGFEELYTFFLNSVGNEDLENESITAFEVGYRGQFLDKSLTIEADAFFNLFRDTIAFHVDLATNNIGMPDLESSVMEYRNRGREVNSLGGSILLSYYLQDDLRLQVNYTYRYSWFISESSEQSVLEGGKGDRVKWERAHLANLSLSYVPEDGLRLGLAVHGSSECDLALAENGLLFDDKILIHSPPRMLVSGFLAWRQPVGEGWMELGVKAFNFLHQGSRDTAAVMRPDGVEIGGELLGRRLFLFLRGSI